MRAESGDRLVAALRKSPPWDHPADDGGLIETHLSWVVLAGEYAYKIKKPVDFGFVDFTTLERRLHFLEEELRLNRRFSDGWYLRIVAFYGSPERPTLVDDGAAPFEYALQMRRFRQSAILTTAPLDESVAEALADRVATFHDAATTAVASPDTPFGSPRTVAEAVEGNYTHIRALLTDPSLIERLAILREREQSRLASLQELIGERKATGHVRELHGDLHRGNIALVDGAPLLFDALEFNPSFRWIDQMSEVAFLVMDLYAAEMPWAARLFLNRYLERTGDYEGVRLLPLYLCYRAMVRAKVALLSRPADEPDDGPCMRRFLRYLSLAERLGAPHESPTLIMTHGLSGCGKSRFTRTLIPLLDGVRVRSDAERLRLYPEREGRYREEATERVYGRLREAAGAILDAGYHAVLDAAFLAARQRREVRAWCEARGTTMSILDFADPGNEALGARLSSRDAADPSEATLDVVLLQREQRDPLADDERRIAIPVNETTTPVEVLSLLRC